MLFLFRFIYSLYLQNCDTQICEMEHGDLDCKLFVRKLNNQEFH